MKRFWLRSLIITAALFAASAAQSQPPGGGPPGGPPGGGPGGRGPRGMPGLLPPHVRNELNLTKDQEKQLADLEKEFTARLQKILTTEQKKKFEEMRRRGGPPGGPGGPPGGLGGPLPGGPDGPPPGALNPDDKPAEKPKKPADDPPQAKAAGIPWFATWESGLAEAKRTGKPILLVSAAPSCGGVSGIW